MGQAIVFICGVGVNQLSHNSAGTMEPFLKHRNCSLADPPLKLITYPVWKGSGELGDLRPAWRQLLS